MKDKDIAKLKELAQIIDGISVDFLIVIPTLEIIEDGSLNLDKVIPKEDIIDGLPIRWAFYHWVSGHSSHGWEFAKWRRYLLSSNIRGYQKVFDVFKDERFMYDAKRFLACNNANTLAGFIRFYQKCLTDYEAEYLTIKSY